MKDNNNKIILKFSMVYDHKMSIYILLMMYKLRDLDLLEIKNIDLSYIEDDCFVNFTIELLRELYDF